MRTKNMGETKDYLEKYEEISTGCNIMKANKEKKKELSISLSTAESLRRVKR